MDILADILEVTRLSGKVFCQASALSPWGLQVDPGPSACLHIVVEGSCWLLAGQQAPRQLSPWDVVLLAHGTGHVLCDDPKSPRIPLREWRVEKEARRAARERARGAPVSTLICGSYTMEAEDPHPVLQLLPEVIWVPGRRSAQNAGLQGTLQLLAAELEAPDVGSEKVVSRLLDVLFIRILRFWLDSEQAGATGWLGALRDRTVAQALALMHQAPAKGWSVESLADAVGLSRPAFARRFAEKVGQPPLAYLTDLRLAGAARLLRTSDLSLAQIAETVGYGSEFAFNRAFRRGRGVPPGRFRKSANAPAAP